MRSRWAVNGFGSSGYVSCLTYLRDEDTFTRYEEKSYRTRAFKDREQRQNLIDCFHWLDEHFYIYYTVPKIIRRSYEESI